MYVFHEFSPKWAEFRHPELLSEESLSWKQEKKVRGLPALQCLGRVQVSARQTASTDVSATSVGRPSAEDNRIIIELL